MFECEYKFTISEATKCAKYVYKSQRRTQEKFLTIAIPVLFVVMSIMLVFDIISHRTLVWDIVLLSSLFVLGCLTFAMPLIVMKGQKKQYFSQKFDEMDCLKIEITNGTCNEKMMKNGEKVLENTHNLKTLVSYIEDEDLLILIYTTGEYTCIKKSCSTGDLNKLKALLQKSMKVKTKR